VRRPKSAPEEPKPAPTSATKTGGIQVNLFVLKSWITAKFTSDERGATMVEYGLLLALVAVAAIIALTFLGGETRDKFNEVGSAVDSAS
jgi:pilus assembly protein Flp/PilA